MQIAPIPQKALSPLLSRCGSSNRYPVRPSEKKHGGEGGKSGFLWKSAITTRGITTQRFRIIKTGACFLAQKSVKLSFSHPACEVKPRTVSQRVRAAGCMVGRSGKSRGGDGAGAEEVRGG